MMTEVSGVEHRNDKCAFFRMV